MERSQSTAWYMCYTCKQERHGTNFYTLPNGARTNECCDCYDKKQSDEDALSGELIMTREQFDKVFENTECNDQVGDHVYQGLQIIAKYTDLVGVYAEHDIIYSEDVDKLIENGITLEDAEALRKLNWSIDEDCMSCFV